MLCHPWHVISGQLVGPVSNRVAASGTDADQVVLPPDWKGNQETGSIRCIRISMHTNITAHNTYVRSSLGPTVSVEPLGRFNFFRVVLHIASSISTYIIILMLLVRYLLTSSNSYAIIIMSL